MTITDRQVSRAAYGIGALLAVYGAWDWWDGARVFARMRPTTCTVLSKKIDSVLLVSGERNKKLRNRDEAHLVLAHTLDGQPYSFSEDFVYDWALYAHGGYDEGKACPCRYDPQTPGRGTIRSAFDSQGSIETLLLGGVALLIGAATPRIWRRAAADLARMRGR